VILAIAFIPLTPRIPVILAIAFTPLIPSIPMVLAIATLTLIVLVAIAVVRSIEVRAIDVRSIEAPTLTIVLAWLTPFTRAIAPRSLWWPALTLRRPVAAILLTTPWLPVTGLLRLPP
jgi:hypothetical protein